MPNNYILLIQTMRPFFTISERMAFLLVWPRQTSFGMLEPSANLTRMA